MYDGDKFKQLQWIYQNFQEPLVDILGCIVCYVGYSYIMNSEQPVTVSNNPQCEKQVHALTDHLLNLGLVFQRPITEAQA